MPDQAMPVFSRVEARPHTLADAALEEIVRLVTSGDLPAGTRLPPERELIGQLGVSRTVLREALSSLEALGLIESRATRGRFIAGGGSTGRSKLLVHAWLNQHVGEIADTMRVRAIVEHQAILDIPDEGLADVASDLCSLIADQARAIEASNVLAASQANQDFHHRLVSGTPNGLLRSLAAGLIDQSRPSSIAIYSDPDHALESLRDHEAIAAALAAGDRLGAARRNADHQLDPLRRLNLALPVPGA